MLVLTRKQDEKVRVGDVVVTVLKIRGDRVQLGFDGPRHVVIDRIEVYESKEVERERKIKEEDRMFGPFSVD